MPRHQGLDASLHKMLKVCFFSSLYILYIFTHLVGKKYQTAAKKIVVFKKITNEAARTNDTTNRTNAAAARTNAIKTKKIIGLRAFFLKVVRFMGKLFC